MIDDAVNRTTFTNTGSHTTDKDMLNDVVNDTFSLDTVEDVRPLLSFVMFVNCSYEVSPEIIVVT